MFYFAKVKSRQTQNLWEPSKPNPCPTPKRAFRSLCQPGLGVTPSPPRCGCGPHSQRHPMRGQPCPRGGLGPSGEGSHPAGCTRAWPRGLRGRRGWHQADPSGASRGPSSPPPAGPWTAHSGRVTLDVGASVCPVALRVRLRCPRRGGSRASAPASRAPPWVCRPSRPLGPEAEPPGGWPPLWEPLHEATASQRPRQLTGSRHERERSRRCSRRAAPRGAAPCHADGATEGTRPRR